MLDARKVVTFKCSRVLNNKVNGRCKVSISNPSVWVFILMDILQDRGKILTTI
jgi:hypothetical protein